MDPINVLNRQFARSLAAVALLAVAGCDRMSEMRESLPAYSTVRGGDATPARPAAAPPAAAEPVRPIERWARVADRVFSSAERAEIGREIASGDEPSSVLLRFWCRGEAELKAIGCGISGLSAHRDGWHPPGLRISDLPSIPLPSDLASEGARYQAAVALWTVREDNASRMPAETSQARPPRITPTSASTA